MRGVIAYILALAVTLSGFVLADARGASHDVGMEIVICSGVGMTVITVGPDGQPVEKSEPCPDGSSVFAASFALPPIPAPEARLIAVIDPVPAIVPAARSELTPSARGPPAAA